MKFSFGSPIERKYQYYRKFTSLTQPFGENKNQLFYGPKGHTGWDIQTQFSTQFTYHNIKRYVVEKVTGKKGAINILAAHDGFLEVGFNDSQRDGVYMKVTFPKYEEDGKMVEYQTLYFHLDSVRVFKGDLLKTTAERNQGNNFVKRGTVLGIGGNSGKYTTGPHLHFEVRKRILEGNTWSEWKTIDPLPYCNKSTIFIYLRSRGNLEYYYGGKKITKAEADSISYTY